MWAIVVTHRPSSFVCLIFLQTTSGPKPMNQLQIIAHDCSLGRFHSCLKNLIPWRTLVAAASERGKSAKTLKIFQKYMQDLKITLPWLPGDGTELVLLLSSTAWNNIAMHCNTIAFIELFKNLYLSLITRTYIYDKSIKKDNCIVYF